MNLNFFKAATAALLILSVPAKAHADLIGAAAHLATKVRPAAEIAAKPASASSYYQTVDWVLGLAENALNGGGSGAYFNANLIAGGGGFMEAVSFRGEGTNFYCGPTISAVTDAQASVGGYGVKALACDKEKYAGGFLTVGVGATFPGFEAGLNSNFSLGVDNSKLARNIGDVVRGFENLEGAGPIIVKAIAMLSDWAKGKGGLLATYLKDPSPTQKAMLSVVVSLTRQLTMLAKVSDKATKDALAGLAENFRGELTKFMKDPAQADLRVTPKSVLGELGDAFNKIRFDAKASGEEKIAAAVMGSLFGTVGDTLTGCDAISGGVSIGVGAVPVTASLSYSHYTHLGSVGEGFARTLRTNSKAVEKMMGSLRKENTSTLAAFGAGFVGGIGAGIAGAAEVAALFSPEDLATMGKVVSATTAAGFAAQCLAPALEPMQALAKELGDTNLARNARKALGL